MSCGPSVTNIFVYIKLNNFNLLSLSSMAKCLKKTYTIFEKNILYLKHQLLLKCVRSELAWHILLLLDVDYIIIISIINYLYWYFRSVSMQNSCVLVIFVLWDAGSAGISNHHLLWKSISVWHHLVAQPYVI